MKSGWIKRWGRWLLGVAGILGVSAVLFLAVTWLVLDWTDEGSERYPSGLVIRDDAGRILRVSLGAGDVDCRPVYAADPEDWIVKALLAAEDDTFWTHFGVRPLSILRAAWQNLFSRRRISGASTITMQAVRLIRPHPKTYWWKYKEAIYALKMERAKDKRWILSQYLNRAPYGSNLVGVEAGAHGWFGKGVKELGLSEAALLAGMVQAPSRLRPDRQLEAALRRRDWILGRMLELGMITDEQCAGAKAVRPVIRRSPRPFAVPYFCDWVLQTAGKDLAAQRTSGEIVTSLNADIQSLAEQAVEKAAHTGGYSSSAVVMRVADGAVLALAVSGDYFDPAGGQVNTALAPRPAGSTLKPFLAALALDRGFATPETRLMDAPIAYRGYRPANFDARYRGAVTLKDALVLSLNIPFVTLLNRIGVESFGDTLRTLGFAHLGVTDMSAGLGMAIGNVEVSLMELVHGYRTLAAGGGDVFSPGAAYLVADMLSGDERSGAALGHIADVPVVRFAWKTGTSSAYRDAWTVLWNPEYVIGVWCGHKSGGFGDRTVVGARAAAPIAWSVARALYPQNAGPWFAEPEGIARRMVCTLTGEPANGLCPETETGRALAGRSATRPCAVHVRGLDGRVVERRGETLAISRPEDGAVFTRVEGMEQQQIVCQAIGLQDEKTLWWFVDGQSVGEAQATTPYPVEMTPGEHTLTCVTPSGRTASVVIRVNAGVVDTK